MKPAGKKRWGATLPMIVVVVLLWVAGRSEPQSLVQIPPTAVNLLVNTDFQKPTENLPDSWFLDRSLTGKGSIKIVPDGSRPGKVSLCLIPTNRNNDPGKPLALAQMIFPEPSLGHKLMVQASMKVTSGAAAHVHLFALSRGKPVAQATISETRSTASFVMQQGSLTVPASTDQLFFLVSASSGAGSACFDGLGVFVSDPDAPTATNAQRPPGSSN